MKSREIINYYKIPHHLKDKSIVICDRDQLNLLLRESVGYEEKRGKAIKNLREEQAIEDENLQKFYAQTASLTDEIREKPTVKILKPGKFNLLYGKRDS